MVDKKTYRRRRKEGKCTNCGKRKPIKHKRLCGSCASARSSYNLTWLKKNPEYMKLYMRRYRE